VVDLILHPLDPDAPDIIVRPLWISPDVECSGAFIAPMPAIDGKAEVEAIPIPFPVYWGGGSGIVGKIVSDYGQKPRPVRARGGFVAPAAIVSGSAAVQGMIACSGGVIAPAAVASGEAQILEWPTEEDLAVALLMLA
jgi:hypothetical protein